MNALVCRLVFVVLFLIRQATEIYFNDIIIAIFDKGPTEIVSTKVFMFKT